MADHIVTKTRIHAGIWEGVVNSTGDPDAAPEIQVSHFGASIDSFLLTKDESAQGRWQLRIAVPPERLSDGVQVFLISDGNSGEKLDAFTIITGEPLEDDIRAEVALLRAELDMLKRAFRRHCVDTA